MESMRLLNLFPLFRCCVKLRNGAIIRHPLGGEKNELEVYQLFTFFGLLMHLIGMHVKTKPTYLYEIT